MDSLSCDLSTENLNVQPARVAYFTCFTYFLLFIIFLSNYNSCLSSFIMLISNWCPCSCLFTDTWLNVIIFFPKMQSWKKHKLNSVNVQTRHYRKYYFAPTSVCEPFSHCFRNIKRYPFRVPFGQYILAPNIALFGDVFILPQDLQESLKMKLKNAAGRSKIISILNIITNAFQVRKYSNFLIYKFCLFVCFFIAVFLLLWRFDVVGHSCCAVRMIMNT